ncbi:uncharacterized protein [Clinocottus analis]|uniref:uncharacterized protein n=1 Tax=Clinocottus analis TaxID=304258 RepID=UPI0035C0A541
MDYGMKEKDPIMKMRFYSKSDPETAVTLTVDEDMKSLWKKQLVTACEEAKLTTIKDDFDIHIVKMDYGMKEKDPIMKMRFYSKSDPETAVTLTVDEDMKSLWKKQLVTACEEAKLTTIKDDFDIHIVKMDYGMKEKDPIMKMRFYSKSDPETAVTLTVDEDMKSLWKKQLVTACEEAKLTTIKDDFDIHIVKMDYGMKEKDPIMKMRFYSKSDPETAVTLTVDEDMKSLWKKQLVTACEEAKLTTIKDDFDIHIVKMDYGMKEKDPIMKMRFYSKSDPETAVTLTVDEDMKSLWKKQLVTACEEAKLTTIKDDFDIHIVKMDYGMKENDPIMKMGFYSKSDPETAVTLTVDEASMFTPTCFSEQLIRVYWKKIDQTSQKIDQINLTEVRKCVSQLCRDKQWPKAE